MESTFRLRRSIIAAMLLALTLVLGRFFLIPIPWTHGNVNLCDAGVFIAAMLLGPGAGTIVGGFGGMFLDLISGFPQDALFPLPLMVWKDLSVAGFIKNMATPPGVNGPQSQPEQL